MRETVASCCAVGMLVCLAASCGGRTVSDCQAGEEACPCRSDGSCNDGLTCLSNVCVDTGANGAAGGPPGGRVSTGPQLQSDRVDLLFVVDNSISMADKQEILRNAVPQLLNRLIDPVCVVPGTTPPVVTQDSSQTPCPPGSEPEFGPVADLHVGVVTSSLGGNGGTLCTPEHGAQYWNETQNDRGRLVARQGPTFDSPPTTWNDMGFLSWDPNGSARNPAPVPGESDAPAMVSNFQNLVTGASEYGCGFESTLEAWYRFLIHPDPPMDVVYAPAPPGETVGLGIDDVLLAQRAAFLRPDSLVAIIMLSDENDCSVIDHGLGYLVGNTDEGAMPRATSVCDTNPNDPCCLSCIERQWPDECNDPQTDPNCRAGLFHGDVDSDQDRLNLRCFDQKRRFGMHFLHPIRRYVHGLTGREVITRTGQSVPNPLYAPNPTYPELEPRANSSLVFLVGIVGVPWQDIATDDSLDVNAPTMRYLSAHEIEARGLWDQILGRPEARPPVPPSDPFMVESVAPREGVNPRTGIAISPPVPGPGGNLINGHEYRIEGNSDLQYACIFPLATVRDCASAQPGQGCDCKVSNEVFDRPLCDDTHQEYAKAYPGTRFLQVLRGYGDNSVVASICPKNPNCANPADVDCGYNPVVTTLIERMQVALPE